MQDAPPQPQEPVRQLPEPAELAAAIAARLCHDFISPAGAINSGVDLLEDETSQDLHDDAITLIGDSAKKLGALLEFYRVAFGASASAERFDVKELKSLTERVFAYQRAVLSFDVPFESLDKPASRALLNLAQIGGLSLPRGGELTVKAQASDGFIVLTAQGTGKVGLKPATIEGLCGKPLTEGLMGYWVQAYYLYSFVRDAGGAVAFEANDETVSLTVRLPR